MNRIIKSRLSIIAVLLAVPMTLVGCTEEMIEDFCDIYCQVSCIPTCVAYWWIRPIECPNCYYACLDFGYCPLESLQGCIDNPDECMTMSELYQAAIDTCEAYPEECAEVLDSYAQSFDTGAEE